MDFASLGKRKCKDSDLEKWYARTIGGQPDCLMGHKVRHLRSLSSIASRARKVGLTASPRPVQQYYMRRKQDADCVIGEKWKDPVGREENCPCEDEDYEWCAAVLLFSLLPGQGLTSSRRRPALSRLASPRLLVRSDYNFAPDGTGHCVPVGPETIPPGQCLRDGDKFKGSSGYRLIPGNTCDVKRGIKKDALEEKPCSAGKETPGLVSHQTVRLRPCSPSTRLCPSLTLALERAVHLPRLRD